MTVARPGGLAAEHHGDQAPAVAHRRGGEVVARGPGVAGLEAVGSGVALQQLVVVAVGAALVAEALGRKVLVVLREVADQRAGQRGHVARRRELPTVVQSRGVAEAGARHAQRRGLLGHAAGEAALAAGQRLGEDHGGVVGRLGDQRQDRVLDRNRPAALQAEPRGWHARGAPRNRQQLVLSEPPFLQGLEGEIERHHLGQRGRIVARVRVDLVQDVARAGVNYDGGVAGLRRACSRRQRCHQAYECREDAVTEEFRCLLQDHAPET